ncbi:MAG: DUF4231 domain-containing protein [Deltaproteobacteria bacterium]|nr:DUF4231 domain-containing protein [Candidatus Desulfobacula maris]
MGERKVALEWYQRIVTVAHGHYRAALRFSRLHYWFSFPSIILATIVGTSVFASLETQPELWLKIAVGSMSIAVAILSALQSFLNYVDKAEKHKTAGAKYNALGRELELVLSQDKEWSSLPDIRRKIDSLAQESPHIPESVHEEMRIDPETLLWNQ